MALESVDEVGDSPVPGLVHGYPDKALFLVTLSSFRDVFSILLLKEDKLASSICPVYCHLCTGSYSVGAETESHISLEAMGEGFPYVEKTSTVQDVVVSGGDSFYLELGQIIRIGAASFNPLYQEVKIRFKGFGCLSESILVARVTRFGI